METMEITNTITDTTTTEAWTGFKQAIQTEATEMALQLINGNRTEVRDFIEGHEFPVTLALAIVRNLWTMSEEADTGALVDAVLNMQALVEMAAI